MLGVRKTIYRITDFVFDYFLLLAVLGALSISLLLHYVVIFGRTVDMSLQITVLGAIFVYLLIEQIKYNKHKIVQKSLLNSLKKEIYLIEKNSKHTGYWDNYEFNAGLYIAGVSPSVNNRSTKVLKEQVIEVNEKLRMINQYLSMYRTRVAVTYDKKKAPNNQGDHVVWEIFDRIKEVKIQMLHNLSNLSYEIKLIEDNR